MNKEAFQFYSENKPPKSTYIYLLDQGKIGIYYTGIQADPRRYVPFSCFDCCFFAEQFNFDSSTLEWKELSSQFVKPCEICKENKIWHFCGKDSHPYCHSHLLEIKQANKIIEQERYEHNKIIEQERYEDNKHIKSIERSKKIFNFFFIKVMIFIAFIVLINTFSGITDFIYRKCLWFQVIDPAVKTSSEELRKIIKSIKE